MKIYIKNMVCNRCTMIIQSELEKLGYKIVAIKLGEVNLADELVEQQLDEIQKSLIRFDFKIIKKGNDKLVEKIKLLVNAFVVQCNELQHLKLSTYIQSNINKEYNYLSNVFSEAENKTIEQFYIDHKIEKIKEYLVDDEISISEIAYRMNYSSVSYLSNQFKKVTGCTPSEFKNLKDNKRNGLGNL